MRKIIAGEVGSALWFFELGISRLAAFQVIVGEAAKGVGNLRPTDVDGFSEQVRAARVKRFDSGARCVEFGLDGRKSSEGCGFAVGGSAEAHAADVIAFGAEACDDYTDWGEEFVGGIPDEVDDI